MSCAFQPHGTTFLHRTDPRVRTGGALLLSVTIALATTSAASMAGLVLAAGAVLAARLPPRILIRRLAGVNLFMLLLLLTLPLSAFLAAQPSHGQVAAATSAAARALRIAIKGNAVVLLCTALITTMEPVTLGHALQSLGTPRKLVQLLLFALRYADLFRQEYLRLRRTMKVRGFSPRMNLHTCRSLGYLAAMLLVNSFDRSDRILAAMKCRGFDGCFRTVHTFAFRKLDAAVATTLLGIFVLLLVLECRQPPIL